MDEKIQELQAKLHEIHTERQAIYTEADQNGREVKPEDLERFEALGVEFERIQADIDRRKEVLAQQDELTRPQGRQTDPEPGHGERDDDDQPDEKKPNQLQPDRNRRPSRLGTERPRIVGASAVAVDQRYGFHSFGEFALSVARSNSGGRHDRRLDQLATSTYGNEGTGADGGFLVPPDFRTAILDKMFGEASLISRTDQMVSSSNQMTLPSDETTPWETSGGVQVYWAAEGSQITPSKPKIDENQVRLHKLTALVNITEELLEDAPAMTNYLRRKVPEKFNWKINYSIVQGTGAGQPRGLLQSGALVTVSAEDGQAADTILFQNIVNMWSRLHAPCRQNAVWLINQDIEPQLLSMSFPGSGTAVPVYLPAGGLSASPYGTLMGRPVIPTEACETLGDLGDIILADLSQYITVTKIGGMRQQVSMHLYFDQDITAFKFTMRMAGQPWWKAPIDRRDGSNTLSCIVTLAERAG